MSSKCSDFNNRTDIKKYIDSGKLKFGIAVWEELINYLEKIGQSGEVIDMRYIRSFMDHKKLIIVNETEQTYILKLIDGLSTL